MVKFRPSWAKPQGATSRGKARTSEGTNCGYGASGLGTEEAFQQPAEMETLGGPHAVEQKQTNGLNG